MMTHMEMPESSSRNKVFRFLIFIILAVVGLSFVVGFRQDRIEILFGWNSIVRSS